MKTTFKLQLHNSAFLLLFILAVGFGCKKDSPVAFNDDPAGNSGNAQSKFDAKKDYSAVNLVTDMAMLEYPSQIHDDNLVNAWGLAFGEGGGVWISSFAKGVSVVYDKNGNTLRRPIPIMTGELGTIARPTAQIVNNTDVFRMPMAGGTTGILGGAPSKFIFATTNGTITAWFGGETAVKVADRSAENAVYTGLAMARNHDGWYLYATDFHNARIDVFDQNFNYISTMLLTDASIPTGYAPFNIKLIGAKLFVTYAKQLPPANVLDQPGQGHGYVSIFNTDGTFARRLASQGTLNSPWGITVFKGNMGFGLEGMSSQSDDENEAILEGNPVILVGNSGDGRISAFDSRGNYLGHLMNNMMPLEIEGLWALSYPPQHNEAYKDVRSRIYFTAGPEQGTHGVFGYIAPTRLQDAMK
jgi:uncharacterized protein (TIGR03118 family)